MARIRIKNWGRWQSYRSDRNQPPWIKLHRRLMNHPEWVSLSDAQRGQLVGLWMLAADREGAIPDDPELLQKLCHMTEPLDLKVFIDKDFLDAKVTPTRRQHDAKVTPQTRLDKTREERAAKAAPKDSGNGHLDPKADLYRRATEVFGPKFGGQITKALNAYGDQVAKVRAIVEQASTKGDPKAYFGGVLRSAGEQPQGPAR